MTLVVLAVALGAVAQAVSGVGFVLVCGPFLIASLGQAEGVRLALVLSLAVNTAVLLRSHRDVAWREALQLLVPAAVLTPVFALAVGAVPQRLAQAVAGLSAVVGALALLAGVRWRAARGPGGAVGAGIVGAAMSVAAGMSGPPVVLWADNAGWAPERTRGTLQVYFLALNLVGIASLGLPHRGAGGLLACLAAIALGLAVGTVVAHRVTGAAARRTTLALAGAGGLVVLVRAIPF